jgi:ATP-binding cassette subfamily C exporter for protease/lipase
MPAVWRVLSYGAVTNLLALAPSVYMLEVYGRVVNSRSHMTLAVLTVLIVGVYIWMEVLEWVRESLLQHLAANLDRTLAPLLFDVLYQGHLNHKRDGSGGGLGDWASLKTFISSPAMVSLLDVPYALVVIFILFFIHPWLGIFSLISAALMGLIGYLTQQGTRSHLQEAHVASLQAQNQATQGLRQAQVVQAMGMGRSLYALWREKQTAFLISQAKASDNGGLGSAATKFIQTFQSSMLLGLGCWLTLNGSLDPSGGMMIMGSILGGRALMPVTQLIGHWRQVIGARDAYHRLNGLLGPLKPSQANMRLPAPSGAISAQALVVQAPNTPTAILKNVQFDLPSGQSLAIVGPSGTGKTSLLRTIIGLWPAGTGKVRLDGVDVYTWDKKELGPHIGYLPQNIELFDGTIAENIARFGPPDQKALEMAVQQVGLSEHIQSMALGFDTPVGVSGGYLSGGLRQRIGLARALYGSPRLLVLDEPNAHLDEAGDAALLQALAHAKALGTSVVMVTHRSQILHQMDQLMILRDGQMQICGPTPDVIEAIKKAMQKPQAGSQPV